jgi:asparagine N-glycosylation enzyme membrane subunit Stt3
MTDDSSRISRYLPWLGILILWAVLQTLLTVTVMDRVFDGELIGTDGYMRLVRVTELAAGSGWYDSTIDRINAPFGDVLHWTRPFDVILLALAAVAWPFASSFDQALLFAGIIVSPLTAGLACVLMAWAVRPVLDKATSFLAAALLLLQSGVISYTIAGRTDHHALQFLIVVLALGLTLRLLTKPSNPAVARYAGVVYAAGVWVSVEMMLLAGLCIGALAVRWIYDTAARPHVLLHATGVFALTAGIALLIERGATDALTVEFDRISIVHVGIAAVTFACWITIDAVHKLTLAGRIIATPRGRLTLGAIAGGVGGVILIALFPDLVVGPFGQLDPRIISIWHERILELRPLVPSNKEGLRDFLFFLGSTTPALILMVYMALREPRSENRAGWLMLLLITSVYFALSLKHLRFAPFAEMAAVPALAELVRRLLKVCTEELSGIGEAAGKIFGSFVLLLGGVFISAAIPSNLTANANTNGDGKKRGCQITDVAPVLSDPGGLGRTRKIIATQMDYGPEILYRTPHAVIGAPYHRNGDGIWDGYWFLATTDAAESKAILTRRKVDLVLACYSKLETKFYTQLSAPGNLYTRLERGELPPWLVQLPYDPDTIGGFRIYQVLK